MPGAGLISAARRRGGAATDPFFSNVILLLGGNGTNGSTTFPDESTAAHTATAQGNAQVSTSVFKFGTGSIALDGTGDYISFPDAASYTFGGDFTIETWVRFSNISTTQTIISHWQATVTSRSWSFVYTGGAGTKTLQLVTSTDGANVAVNLQGNWSPSVNTWYHICGERSGNTWRVYADGVMLGSTTSAAAINNTTANLAVGAQFNGAGAAVQFVNGFLDELRVTSGTARYASDGGYTVPTAAFPRS